MVFYAIFWGVLLPIISKFSPFGINGFNKGWDAAKKNFLRFALAIVILNILPAIWLIILLKWVVSDDKTLLAIFVAAISSISVFGFLNWGYAVFGTKLCVNYLYTPTEFTNLKINFEDASSRSLFLLGLIYFLMFPMLGIVVVRLFLFFSS